LCRPEYVDAASLKSFEGLGAGDFMYEVFIYV